MVTSPDRFSDGEVVAVDHFPADAVCWTCDVVRVPDEVTRYLDAVTARVRDVSASALWGLHDGFVALGDYRSGHSDIDLMGLSPGQRILIFVGD